MLAIDYVIFNLLIMVNMFQMLNVLSMSLLENDLYVINHHNHSIVRLVRYDAHREATLVQTPVENPIVIKAYHQVKQPNRECMTL